MKAFKIHAKKYVYTYRDESSLMTLPLDLATIAVLGIDDILHLTKNGEWISLKNETKDAIGEDEDFPDVFAEAMTEFILEKMNLVRNLSN